MRTYSPARRRHVLAMLTDLCNRHDDLRDAGRATEAAETRALMTAEVRRLGVGTSWEDAYEPVFDPIGLDSVIATVVAARQAAEDELAYRPTH